MSKVPKDKKKKIICDKHYKKVPKDRRTVQYGLMTTE